MSQRGGSLCFSLAVAGTWGIFSNYNGDGPSKLVFLHRRQDFFLVAKYTSVFSSWLGKAIGTPLQVTCETQGLFPVATGILGFLSMFKNGQASSHFEALNSAFDLSCHRDVKPPVEMSQGSRAFYKVCTGDSDLSSSCEMEDEPAFKSLQGNPAFIRVRASWCLFHLRQQTQGPSHIPITETSLLFTCLWKVGIPLELKPGNQLSPRDDL